MGIVNSELLTNNVKRIRELQKVGLSDETIASAARDKTGDASITAQDIGGFAKISNIGSKQMLISANQGKKLTKFAKRADAEATAAVTEAKEKSKDDVITCTEG